MSEFFNRQAQELDEGDSWLSVSDLMAGLMMIFLFIAIVYIKDIVKEKDEIENITVTWSDIREQIYKELKSEFQNDLQKWEAKLNKESLTIVFTAPDILFGPNETSLKPKFEEILDDFFPRYLSVLKKFKTELAEIRIEGHTSSEWSDGSSDAVAYFKNMELSQGRTRAVLEYSMGQADKFSRFEWSRKLVTANGLSSSQPIIDTDGEENAEKSRRVEFRVRTNADKKIQEIINKLNNLK